MANGSAEWQAGYGAGSQGKSKTENPHELNSPKGRDWNQGHLTGSIEAEQRKKFRGQNQAFTNGRLKATQEINNRIQNAVGDRYETDENIKPNHGIIAQGPGYYITRKNSGVVQVIKQGKVAYEGDEAGARKFTGYP